MLTASLFYGLVLAVYAILVSCDSFNIVIIHNPIIISCSFYWFTQLVGENAKVHCRRGGKAQQEG